MPAIAKGRELPEWQVLADRSLFDRPYGYLILLTLVVGHQLQLWACSLAGALVVIQESSFPLR